MRKDQHIFLLLIPPNCVVDSKRLRTLCLLLPRNAHQTTMSKETSDSTLKARESLCSLHKRREKLLTRCILFPFFFYVLFSSTIDIVLMLPQFCYSHNYSFTSQFNWLEHPQFYFCSTHSALVTCETPFCRFSLTFACFHCFQGCRVICCRLS